MIQMETIMIIKKNEDFDLKLDKNLRHHFEWYVLKNSLSVVYYENFKNKIDFTAPTYLKLQISFLNYIENDLSKIITTCYIFLAFENYGTKIEDYYKVWKKVRKQFDLENFFDLQEIGYKTEDQKNYYIGLASFNRLDLKTAFAIQKSYFNQSFIFINTSDSKNIDIKDIASDFLRTDTNEGFKNIITKYCTKSMFIIRIGDGGEDWEIALIFPS